MAFKSTRLPSGRWRGGFYHPVLKKKIQKGGFDFEWEADAWALTEEDRATNGAASEPSSPPPPVVDGAAGAGAPATIAQPRPTAPARTARWVGPTVGEYGRKWLARRSVERATRNKYSAFLSGLGVQVHPDKLALADIPMGLLRRDAVEEWLVDSQTAGVGRPSINGRLRLLRSLYADLLDGDEHHAEVGDLRDPTRRIKFLTEDQDPDYVVPPEEEAVLLAAAMKLDRPQLAVAMLVALEAGLRWQEVYALRVSAISGEFIVVSHVVERGSVQLRAFTKGKKPRVVPMTERLSDALAPIVIAARKRGGNQALLFPAHGDPNRVRKDRREDLVAGRIPWDYGNHRKRDWLPILAEIDAAEVVYRDTGRVRRDGTPIMQKRYVEAAFGFHALRHTYGSRLAAQGVPRAEIAELMGHADERTTGRYIHAGVDGRRLELVRAALGTKPAPLAAVS